jgi:hypothetical protein
VVFLPSKQHAEIAVPNRFFAVAEDGELKIRGLECRRHDTPPLVARMQKRKWYKCLRSEAVRIKG